MNYPNSLAGQTQLLAKDQLNPKHAEAFDKLTAQGYEIHTGLTVGFADAITEMANEPSIRAYCPRDCTLRFADRKTTIQWLSKGRATFLLLKRSGSGQMLGGYGWVGSASSPQVPGGETTFAVRIG